MDYSAIPALARKHDHVVRAVRRLVAALAFFIPVRIYLSEKKMIESPKPFLLNTSQNGISMKLPLKESTVSPK